MFSFLFCVVYPIFSLFSCCLYDKEEAAAGAAAYSFTEKLPLFAVLAGLISYGTGSLACRLAGSLALATSAFFHGVLQSLSIQSLNMFHPCFLLNDFST